MQWPTRSWKSRTTSSDLATAANPFLAHIWRQALEEEDIRCKVFGDYLDAGIGDISGISSEVWVEGEDFSRAEAILREHAERIEKSEETEEE